MDDTTVETPMTTQYQSGNSIGVLTGLKILTDKPDSVSGSDVIKLVVQISIKPKILIKKVFHH